MNTKTNYKILFCLSIFFCHSFLFSQSKELEEDFEALAYINAREIYLDVAKQGYSSTDLFRKLADSYYFSGDIKSSAQWYEKLISEFPQDIKPEYLFRYAQSLISIEKYTEADNVINQLNTLIGADKKTNPVFTESDYMNFIESQSGKYEVFTLDINSPNSDYAPSFTHTGEMVFASTRNKKGKVYTIDNMPFLDLFSSTIKEDKVSNEQPIKLEGKINSKYHESSTTFTRDGQTVYFSRNNFTDNKLGKTVEGLILLKIYRAKLINGKWSDVTELPFNIDNFSFSHPALSDDDKKLYFASDMPGTKGKSDIFVVDILPGDQYSEPRNLGGDINTEYKETFPFISVSGQLYFSSDGHHGLGGLDVFVSVADKNGSYSVFNVGKPINSPNDDFSFVLDEEHNVGYFASNRPGGKGNDDIYSFRQTEQLVTTCKEYVKGIVTNVKGGEIMADIDISLFDIEGNAIGDTKSDSNGVYSFEIETNKSYVVRASIEGFDPIDTIFTSKNTCETISDVPVYFKKEKLLSTEMQAINVGDDIIHFLRLKTIYFDLDTNQIRPDAIADLQKVITVLKQNPNLKIYVNSHTDSRSSYWYNKKLSVKRMRATVSYITENGGINWRRLHGKAYGERRLINGCSNGVPCTEEQHQENRRSEFIIKK